MALMAVLMCVNFAACSDDDGDGSGGGGGDKRLKEIRTIGDGYVETVTYNYDEDGELIQAVEEEEGEDDGFSYKNVRTYKFHWTDNSIEIDREDDYGYGESYTYSFTLALEGGIVQSSIQGSFNNVTSYNYNNGRIASIDYGYNEDRLNWSSDKLMSLSYGDECREYSYGTTCSKGFFPLLGDLLNGEYSVLFGACPELIGARTNKLPTKVEVYYEGERYSSFTVSYKYNDGYVSQIIKKLGELSATTYITWE